MGKVTGNLGAARYASAQGDATWKAMLRRAGLSAPSAALFLLLALVPVVVRDEYLTRLLVSALMLGTHSMAFDFTAGFINVVNFGYSAFWGLGGYASGLLAVHFGIPGWVGMLGGAALSALVGFLLGLLTLRLRGIYASCMSWFLALALMAVTANWTKVTRGHSGLRVPGLFDVASNVPYFYTMLFVCLLTFGVLTWVVRSRIGLAFLAIGQDLEAAKSCGINPLKYRVLNFTVACAFAGLVGGFYAHYVGVMTPRNLHTTNTVEVMAVSYLGGRGSIWGGVVAALVLVPVMEYLRPFLEVRLIAYGCLLIACMLFFPDGVAGLVRGGAARWVVLHERIGKRRMHSGR